MVLHFSPGKPFLASKVEEFEPMLENVLMLFGDNGIQLNSSSFYILHVILFRYCGKYDQEVGSKVINTSKYLQLCQHQLHVRNTSE